MSVKFTIASSLKKVHVCIKYKYLIKKINLNFYLVKKN